MKSAKMKSLKKKSQKLVRPEYFPILRLATTPIIPQILSISLMIISFNSRNIKNFLSKRTRLSLRSRRKTKNFSQTWKSYKNRRSYFKITAKSSMNAKNNTCAFNKTIDKKNFLWKPKSSSCNDNWSLIDCSI